MPGLDVLRAVAALLVVAFHLTHWTWLDHSTLGIPGAFTPMQPISSRGWVGVQIFFVLSGFVIAYSMEGLTPLRFVRHRVERLFPAAIFCASLTLLVLMLFSHEAGLGSRWLRSVVFWPEGPWIDGSYWTLPIEIAFYALMAAVLLLGRGRYFEHVVLTLGTLSACCDLLLLNRPDWLTKGAYLALGRGWFPPYACFLLVYGAFFALGSLLFLLLVKGQSLLRYAGALITMIGCLAEICWHDRGLVFADPPRRGGWASVCLWAVAVGLLIVSVRFNSGIRSKLHPGVLKSIRCVGLMTYPLYLLHAQIGEWLVHGLYRRFGALPALFCACGAVLTLALFVTAVIEPRLREVLKRGLDVVEANLSVMTARAND